MAADHRQVGPHIIATNRDDVVAAELKTTLSSGVRVHFIETRHVWLFRVPA